MSEVNGGAQGNEKGQDLAYTIDQYVRRRRAQKPETLEKPNLGDA
ncbi:hypothetical protein X801_06968 [Opisthorchis viverrini]|nr:hypothetical protein X801_06968 [Opisthorchis viverrini]